MIKASRTSVRLAAALLLGVFTTSAVLAEDYDANATIQIGSLYEPQNLDNTAGAGQGINEAFNGNVYQALFQLTDAGSVEPQLVDSYTKSDDGLTYTFKLKPDLKFASGNPVTADDVVFSIERLIKLDKSPAFLFNQFGLNGDNVTDKVKAIDPLTVSFTVDKPYASSFVLNVMSSAPASVVDKKLVMEHAEAVAPSDTYKWETDFGNQWLKTNSAGSGPFSVVTWKANEAVVLERNDNYYGDAPALKRVIYRHMKESAGQRLALENGDVDNARNLSPSDLDAIANNANLAVTARPKGTVYYISLNQKNENLAKPEVIEAMKYLVDYDAIGATLIKGIGTIHQSFLPIGQLGAIEDNPYSLDVAKAKELLAAAGLSDGFSVTMDVRNTQPVTGIAENFQQT
ncbi:MAG: ABC transporter substrate-binding protein, partial [Novosphingobium sp.]